MATIDEIGTPVADEEGRKKIRALVLRLGIFIGLDFDDGKKGKRDVRADVPAPGAAGHGGNNHTH